MVNVLNLPHDVGSMQSLPSCQKNESTCSSQKISTNDEMKSIKKLWTPMPLSPPSILASPRARRIYSKYLCKSKHSLQQQNNYQAFDDKRVSSTSSTSSSNCQQKMILSNFKDEHPHRPHPNHDVNVVQSHYKCQSSSSRSQDKLFNAI